MNKFEKTNKALFDFIDRSPSCFHAVANVATMLEKAGFVSLSEKECWSLDKGGRYYVTRNDSSIIAFTVPEGKAKGFHMVASHSDSPSFRIKDDPEMILEDKYIKLNTEKYGGMIMSTWFDRPLSVAGRVAVKEKVKSGKVSKTGKTEADKLPVITTRLVNVDRDLCVIPNLAIHMCRDMNDGVKYDAQVDMLPLFADNAESDGKGALKAIIAKEVGVESSDVLEADLYLYTRQKGIAVGEHGEFIMSPRLDDLQCVFSSVSALIQASESGCNDEYINVCAVFDNEEVGSGTKQGADSTFLSDTMERIGDCLGAGRQQYLAWIADSFMISADNAHAVHPNHPEKADPTNRPYLNGGPVMKFHGGQKYTTDAASGAFFRDLCNRAGVPCQTYFNKSNIAGGSTLGNISTAHVSLASVDIGLPQLAMHSAVETAGGRDTQYCIEVMKLFYQG